MLKTGISYFAKDKSIGVIYENEIHFRRIVKVAAPEAIDTYLLEAFNEIYKQTGRERPKGLYDFPGPAAYKNLYY